MYRLLMCLALLSLLAACADGSGYAAPVDYNAAAVRAAATVQYATAAAIAADEARDEADRRATRQAAQTRQASEAEIARIETELNATRQALYLRQTQDTAAYNAAAYAATATQGVAATATAWQITATPLYATQSAIGRQVRSDEAKAEREVHNAAVWALVEPLVILMLAATACAIIYKVSSTLLEWWIEWRDRKASLYETRQGTVVFRQAPDGSGYVPQLLAGNRPRQVQPETDAAIVGTIPIYVNGKRWNPLDNRPDTTLALASQLIADAIALGGPQSDRLPGWRNLPGWSSEKWQRAVAALKSAGAVITEAGGTRVSSTYDNLEDVQYALETRTLRPRPAPYSAE